MVVACDSCELSYDLYKKVEDLPETFTRLQIKDAYMINVNGDASLDNPNLLSAVHKNGQQLIVKVLKKNYLFFVFKRFVHLIKQ